MTISISREDLLVLILSKEPNTDEIEEYLLNNKFGYSLNGKWVWNDLSNNTNECLLYLYKCLTRPE